MTACMMLYTPLSLPIVDLLWSSRQLGHGARAQGESLRGLSSPPPVSLSKADVMQQVKLEVDVQKEFEAKRVCATSRPSSEFPVSQTGTQRTGATATLA